MGALRRISRTAKLRGQREPETNDTLPTSKVNDTDATRGASSPDRIQVRQEREGSEKAETRV